MRNAFDTSFPTRCAAGALLFLGMAIATPDKAQASCTQEPMLGDICWTAADFCPQGYTIAAGQPVDTSKNQGLYALIAPYAPTLGTTFNLPDLRGRSLIEFGSAPYADINQGSTQGTDQLKLAMANMPVHAHAVDPNKITLSGTISASANTAGQNAPGGLVPAMASNANMKAYSNDTSALVAMAPGIISGQNLNFSGESGITGASAPIIPGGPRLGLTACIATTGYFPPRP